MNVLGDMLDVKKSKSPGKWPVDEGSGFNALGGDSAQNYGGYREVNQVLLFTKSCQHKR